MQFLPYPSLTAEQRGQVDYLFADSTFGTDAGAFVYEVDRRGDVTGRTASALSSTARARQSAPVKVTMKEAQVHDGMISNAQMHTDALAAFVAEKIFQSNRKLEEVIK